MAGPIQSPPNTPDTKFRQKFIRYAWNFTIFQNVQNRFSQFKLPTMQVCCAWFEGGGHENLPVYQVAIHGRLPPPPDWFNFPETFVQRFSIKNGLNEKITLKISVPHLSISSMVWGNSPRRWFSISWTLETQQNTVGEIKDRYRSKILPQSDLRSWCVMLLRVASCCFHLHFSSGSLRA